MLFGGRSRIPMGCCLRPLAAVDGLRDLARGINADLLRRWVPEAELPQTVVTAQPPTIAVMIAPAPELSSIG